ncbi:gluconate:H+ symporter [Spongiivirga citrea]|uniref:Gluconate transporter n=1 Tax=Spongiivirga citrea TaxID=1481457 RepID=A0A6M0CYW0_9FLAO|nr:gluconate:H+ symporter [Spongiivirga citrea]NER18950.1 gluconate transporter [Spongiivirga citrea]
MILLIVVLGIGILLLLTAKFKLNAFLAFIIVCFFIGIFGGIELNEIINSIQTGIGKTLSFLTLILGLGAMLGKLVADSGAAQKITSKLIEQFGIKNIQWAVMITGFIVGIPMFYSVGFVILIPIVFTVAAASGLPLLYVGVPMLASLSVTHGFLPPHPAPTAIAGTFDADIGKTILYGICIAIPAIIVAGLFSRTLKHIKASPLEEFYNVEPIDESQIPSTLTCILTALSPVLLIGLSALLVLLVPEDSASLPFILFLGDPAVAMFLAVMIAIFTLGIARGKKMKEISTSLTQGVASIAMILLIISGAGALKQVLDDTGADTYIGELLMNTGLSPLFLGWLIATLIRVCVGSATIAGLTAAGIVASIVSPENVNPELMVLAIGAGSLMFSHVNDSGFWMFKEYFGLSIKQTFRSWTIMETIVGTMGLIGVLVLDLFI